MSKDNHVPPQWPGKTENRALCAKCHLPNAYYARCLRCCIMENSAIFSRMCYAIEGVVNELGCSTYDVIPYEDMVLAKLQVELATLRFAVWKLQRENEGLKHERSRLPFDHRDLGWG